MHGAEVIVTFLLRCPALSLPTSGFLAHRPLPLALVAYSAPGSAPIAPPDPLGSLHGSSNSSLSSCLLGLNYAPSVSMLLKSRQLSSCKHYNNQLSACLQKRHSAPGEVSEGWLALREQGAQRPSEPLLWVLSVRPQKVPPPAGTGTSDK